MEALVQEVIPGETIQEEIIPGENINGFPSYLYFTSQSLFDNFINTRDDTQYSLIEMVIATYLFYNRYSNNIVDPHCLIDLIIGKFCGANGAVYGSFVNHYVHNNMFTRLANGENIMDVMKSFTVQELLWILNT